jgi:uncharacterized protein YuzE
MPSRTPIAVLPQNNPLRVTHDTRTNVAYIHLADRRVSGGPRRSEYALGQRVVLDLDAEGRILGIELLDARLLRPETLEEVAKPKREPKDCLEELDRKVLAASLGDRAAADLLYRTYARVLVVEARKALGLKYRKDAEDLVQDLWVGLAEGSFRFPFLRGAGLPWLRRTVRALAAEHVRKEGAR